MTMRTSSGMQNSTQEIVLYVGCGQLITSIMSHHIGVTLSWGHGALLVDCEHGNSTDLTDKIWAIWKYAYAYCTHSLILHRVKSWLRCCVSGGGITGRILEWKLQRMKRRKKIKLGILPDLSPVSVLLSRFISAGGGTTGRYFWKLKFSSLPNEPVSKYLLLSTS